MLVSSNIFIYPYTLKCLLSQVCSAINLCIHEETWTVADFVNQGSTADGSQNARTVDAGGVRRGAVFTARNDQRC